MLKYEAALAAEDFDIACRKIYVVFPLYICEFEFYVRHMRSALIHTYISLAER